jgi:molecular chaperone GrpE
MFARRERQSPDSDPRPEDGHDAHDPAGAGDPDETASLIDTLTRGRDEAIRERDEMADKWKRALAEYQNYQRRAAQNEVEARREGSLRVLHSVVPVLDHFDIALSGNADPAAAPYIEGMKVIRSEIMRALELHGVTLINPQPNETFEPGKHEAIMQQPAAGVESGRIAKTFQTGYAMDGRVFRSAKVAVAP